MKKCPTCQEEFANEFSYCPVDATPLNHGFTVAPTTATAAAPVNAGPAPQAAAHTAAAGNGSFSPPASADSGTHTVNRPNGHEAPASATPPPSGTVGSPREEYHLTILEDTGIATRLSRAINEVAHESQLSWPEFKRDPAGFTGRMVKGYGTLGWRFISNPNVAIALTTAFVMVFAMIGAVIAFDRLKRSGSGETADARRDDLVFQGMVTEIPEEQEKPEEGTAGMNKGDGGGSKPKFEKPGGGGGGGREEQKPASAGKLPQASLDVPQVVAPDPRPPTVKNPSLPVPATIYADPKLFPTDNRPLPYGDPKSKSTETSSGPGTGNGIGTGTGGGVGSGEGGGVGPGRGGNTGGGDFNAGGGGAGGGGGGGPSVFAARDVTTKAVITSKPEPSYTEEARKNNVTGTVVLRAILSSSGQVTGITPVQRLPYGLTEKAIAAARQIQFRPATKDGRAVSQYVRIEYNFNMY